MRFTYQGKQIFKSTETEERNKPSASLTRIKFEIAEGKWFEKKSEHSFKEMMDRYLTETRFTKENPQGHIRDT